MPKIKLKDTLNRVVRVDTDAGATLGVNLRDSTGRVIKPSEVLNSAAPEAKPSNYSNTLWKLIREIPANIQALAALAGLGFATRRDDGSWTQRTIAEAEGITIANGDGQDGDPAIGLADLPDSGEGAALVKVTRDSKGRVEGTEAAKTDDLAEGATNRYFTSARADARIELQKGQPGGLATLDVNSKLDAGQLPALAITDTFVVSTEAAMLALDAQQGDVAVRSDEQKSYILTDDPASTLANWQELLTPTSVGVASFNGRTGSVVPASGDYTPAQVGADSSGSAAAAQAFAIQRSNHTGSQLAETISDFANATRSTPLTGLSLVSNAPILATDTMLISLGKLQSQMLDGGWIPPALLNSWSNLGGSYAPASFRKLGQLVTIRGTITGGDMTNGTIVFVLPAGYRPPFVQQFSGASTSSSPRARIIIRQNGNLQIYDFDEAPALDGISFFVN